MKIPVVGITVPGPGDVAAVASSLSQALQEAGQLVPRMVELVARSEAVIAGLEALLQRIDVTVTRVNAVVEASAATVDRVNAAVDESLATVARVNSVVDDTAETVRRAAEVVERSDGEVTRVEAVRGGADRAVAAASDLIDRTNGLLGAYEPALHDFVPVVRRLDETLRVEQVDAAAGLITRLPELLDDVEELLPILHTFEGVAPDVQQIRAALEELRHLASGVPGVEMLRRRAEEDQDTS